MDSNHCSVSVCIGSVVSGRYLARSLTDESNIYKAHIHPQRTQMHDRHPRAPDQTPLTCPPPTPSSKASTPARDPQVATDKIPKVRPQTNPNNAKNSGDLWLHLLCVTTASATRAAGLKAVHFFLPYSRVLSQELRAEGFPGHRVCELACPS